MFTDLDMERAWADWMDIVVSVSHLLATVNSSLNFVIYCYKDEKFRNSLMMMLKFSKSPSTFILYESNARNPSAASRITRAVPV